MDTMNEAHETIEEMRRVQRDEGLSFQEQANRLKAEGDRRDARVNARLEAVRSNRNLSLAESISETVTVLTEFRSEMEASRDQAAQRRNTLTVADRLWCVFDLATSSRKRQRDEAILSQIAQGASELFSMFTGQQLPQAPAVAQTHSAELITALDDLLNRMSQVEAITTAETDPNWKPK